MACPHNCPNPGDLTINGPKCQCVGIILTSPQSLSLMLALGCQIQIGVCWGGIIVSPGLVGTLHTFQNVSLGDSGVEPVMFSQEYCVHPPAYLHSSFPQNTKTLIYSDVFKDIQVQKKHMYI